MMTKELKQGFVVCIAFFFISTVAVVIPAKASLPSTPKRPCGALDFILVIHGDQGKNGWYISFPTIELVFTNGTIPGTVFYALDGDMFQPYTAPVHITCDGIHIIVFQVTDQNGTVYTHDISIKVDTTSPTVTLTKHSGLFAVTVSGTAFDNTSGIWYVIYSIDGLEQINDTTPPFAFAWRGHSSHTITATAVDNAGLTSTQAIPYIPPGHFPHLHDLLLWVSNHLRQ